MSVELDLLLGAILQRPDDDEPRLVYADALLSRGDPRGEFINIQCELARLGNGGPEPFQEWIGDELMDRAALASGRVSELRRREAELLRLHGASWARPISASAVTKEAVHFRRGFVERVAWNAAGSNVASIFEMAPLVRSLQFVSYDPSAPLEAFFRSPQTERLRELHAIGDPHVVPFLATCEQLRNLQRFVHSHAGGPHNVNALQSASFMPTLQQLVLDGVRLESAEVDGFLSVPESLLELQCIGGALGSKGATALLSKPSTRKLLVLCLRHQRLGLGGVSCLVAAPARDTLQALDLRTNQLGAVDLKLLASCIERVRVLDLGNNPLGDDAMEAFNADGVESICALSLQQTRLGERGLRTLLGSRLAPRLRVLDLRKNFLKDEAAQLLAQSDQLQSLETLYIGGNKLGAAAKNALRSSRSLGRARIYL